MIPRPRLLLNHVVEALIVLVVRPTTPGFAIDVRVQFECAAQIRKGAVYALAT